MSVVEGEADQGKALFDFRQWRETDLPGRPDDVCS